MQFILGAADESDLQTRFDTLRRIPRLPPLADARLGPLRDDLISLPVDQNLVDWLPQHRPNDVSQYALQWAVLLLHAQARGTAHVVQSGFPVDFPPDVVEFFKSIAPDDPLLVDEMPGPSDNVTVSDLSTRLAALRRFPLLRDEADPSQTGSVYLHQLFALPPSVDPLRWTIDHHLETAATLTLQNIVTMSMVSGRRGVGRVVRKIDISVAREFQFGDVSLRYELDRLQLTEHGFKISGSFELEGLPPPKQWVHIGLEWNIFGKVEDDLGARYMVASHRGNSSFEPYVQEWEVGYTPAPQPGATAIRFGDTHARLHLVETDQRPPIDPRRGPRQTIVETFELGNIVTSIDLTERIDQ